MKRKGVKKSNSKKKAYKSLALSIGIIVLLSLVIGFVSFGDNSSITGNVANDYQAQGGFFKSLFGSIGEGSSGPSEVYPLGAHETITPLFAKYILFFMITMMIFWIIGDLVKPEDPRKIGWVSFGKILFSLAVATLTIGFIRFDELFSIMTTYSALGLTLSILVPFALVMALASKLVSSKVLTVPKIMVQRALWYVYSAFLIYFLISTMIPYQPEIIRANIFLNIMIGLILVASLYFAIFNSRYMGVIRRLKKVADDATFKAEQAEIQRAAAGEISRTRTQKIIDDLKTERRAHKKTQHDLGDLIK